jgi:hypothetical protein
LHRKRHLKRQRRDRINEQLTDGIVKGAPRNLLAHRLATLDAPSLAHVIGHRARASLMITHSHSLTGHSPDRQPA